MRKGQEGKLRERLEIVVFFLRWCVSLGCVAVIPILWRVASPPKRIPLLIAILAFYLW